MTDGPAPGDDQRADGPDRRERLPNLLAALIETRAGLTREDLVTNPALGYSPNPASARRAFERDKATLRAMGVPIRDIGDDPETRYRVDPKEYYLPDLGLTDDELAALHVAVTAVGLGSTAGEGALMKLGGIEGAGAAPIAELPFVDVLAPLFEASRRRAVVHFSYRGRLRELEPWGLTSKFGHWYVVGFDRGADDMRVYRADRVEGDIDTGRGGSFTVPVDFRADSYLEDRPWDYGEGRATDVVVEVDPGYEVGFCQAVGPEARVETTAAGTTRVTIRAVEIRAVVNFVLGFLDHVEILSPPEARAALVAALEAWTSAEATPA
jgi:predicted DNA-binding transcriptional regulator YafY